eukprot:c23681_g1_i1 orf=234-1025(+)
MSSLPVRQKRKEPDECVVDLFGHVSLAPAKRLRQDMSLPTIYEERPISVVSVDQSLDDAVLIPESTELPTVIPALLPDHLPADERAIVLYKPVNPPLFPGGPEVSDGLPIRVHSKFLSGPNGLLDASSSLSSPWLPGRLPMFSGAMALKENLILEASDQLGKCSDNKLAMIPWLPPQVSLHSVGLVGSSSQEAGACLNQATDGAVDSDQMPIEGECDATAMEEDSVPENSTMSNNGTAPIRGAEPWQHFGVALPSYAPVMQSH